MSDTQHHQVVIITTSQAFWYCRDCQAQGARALPKHREAEVVREAQAHGEQVADPVFPERELVTV